MKLLIPVTVVPMFIIGILTTFLTSPKAMSYGERAKVPEVPEGHEVITLGAGCFWCVEAVLQRIDGIKSVTSGYSNGETKDPTYEQICTGATGHAEVVRVVYDPKTISTATILEWFWKLHDPTTLNRQGHDVGTQYRSGIYYHTEEQKAVALASKEKANKTFKGKIVTEIEKAETFYAAEVNHQNYYKINGNKNPYCRAIIPPKLKKLGLDEVEEKED